VYTRNNKQIPLSNAEVTLLRELYHIMFPVSEIQKMAFDLPVGKYFYVLAEAHKTIKKLFPTTALTRSVQKTILKSIKSRIAGIKEVNLDFILKCQLLMPSIK
jgi:hypothetical protein